MSEYMLLMYTMYVCIYVFICLFVSLFVHNMTSIWPTKIFEKISASILFSA